MTPTATRPSGRARPCPCADRRRDCHLVDQRLRPLAPWSPRRSGPLHDPSALTDVRSGRPQGDRVRASRSASLWPSCCSGPALRHFSALRRWSLCGLRREPDGTCCVNNVATFMWFPLVAGLFFHELVRLAHLGPHALAYYLVVFRDVRHRAGRELRRGVRVTGAISTGRRSVGSGADGGAPAPVRTAVLGAADDGRRIRRGRGRDGRDRADRPRAPDLPVPDRRAPQVQAARRAATPHRHHRRTDRPRQPRAVPRAPGRADRHRESDRRDVRRDAARPRSLQGDQRHARPPLRRRAAARPRAAAGRSDRAGRPGGATGRR